MDKETIAEYGNTAILLIVVLLVIIILTGSLFTTKMQDLINRSVPEVEQIEYENNNAYREYITNNTPVGGEE